MVGHGIRRRGDSGMGERCVGANVDDDHLHDDLQFASRDLPSRVFPTSDAAARYLNAAAAPGPDRWSQFGGEHDVHHELHDDTAELSDRLFQ
jgi:hypothetical protein